MKPLKDEQRIPTWDDAFLKGVWKSIIKGMGEGRNPGPEYIRLVRMEMEKRGFL